MRQTEFADRYYIVYSLFSTCLWDTLLLFNVFNWVFHRFNRLFNRKK